MLLQKICTMSSIAVLVWLWGSPSFADIYEITYSGTVTGVTGNLSSGFSVGQTLTGTALFDSGTSPVSGGTVNSAVFEAILSHSFAISGGSTSYSAMVPFSLTGKPEIQIDNAGGGFPNDRFAMLSRASEGLAGSDVNGLALNFLGIRYDDSTNSAFSTALTLPTNIDFADFDSSSFFLFFGPGLEGLVNGEMNSLSFSAVPEPGSAMLLLSGLPGLLTFRRRWLFTIAS